MLAALSITACTEQGVICTMEFRMLSMEILGDSNVRIYTIDNRTGDTVEGYGIFDSNWCFADDGEWFKRLKENEKQTSNITAISKGGKNINTSCVIIIDACNIEKVSWPKNISYL